MFLQCLFVIFVHQESISFHLYDTTLTPNSSQVEDKHWDPGREVGAPNRREWRVNNLALQRGVGHLLDVSTVKVARAWIHLAFLLAVTLTPFSTGLLAAFITFRLAIVVYWLNIVLLGIMLFVSWRYAQLTHLMKDEVTTEICSANERRIVIAQSLYAFGALLCVINTYVSIGFIVLVQLNYAIAPRFGRLDRL